MKCLKLLFSKDGIVNNIGNYVLLSILLLNIVLSIHFILKDFDNFCNKIKELVQKIEENNKNNYIKKSQITNSSKFNLKNKKINKYKGNNKIKKMNYRTKDSKNKNKKKKDFNLLIKENNINNHIALKKSISSNNSLSNSTKNNLKIYKINKKIKSEILIEEPKIIEYNDYELNNLEYQKALEIDKRKYLEYYISLIKRKQIIIFTFYTNDDYNSKVIKISLFSFSFSQ